MERMPETAPGDTGSHTGGAAVPSGLMEELKETLAEYITRTLGIHPEKKNLLSGKSERADGIYGKGIRGL